MVWQYFFISECDSTTDSETSTYCTALTRRSTILLAMTGLGQSSAIVAYQSQANRMKRSHDENGSIQMNMYSLGVMDLDLSISPDVFGLRAFDDTKPVTRMLPGSSLCELRLMLPDDKLGNDGFHDVIDLAVVIRFAGGSHVVASAVAESSLRHPMTPGFRCRTPSPRRPEAGRQGVSLWRTRLLWRL